MLSLVRKMFDGANFDPSKNEIFEKQDLVRVLRGKVIDSSKRNPVYFVVCRNGLHLPNEGNIDLVRDLGYHFDRILDRSEWFGKFPIEGQAQVIVPGKYNLRVNPDKKLIHLQEDPMARYYGSGNLQMDKDEFTKVILTDICISELRGAVNSTCGKYKGSPSLEIWN